MNRFVLAASVCLLGGCIAQLPPEFTPPPLMSPQELNTRQILSLLERDGFRGDLAIYQRGGVNVVVSSGSPTSITGAAWPWASVTKQVLAVLIMQEVEAGRIDLDASASTYLPALAGGPSPTVRQLLQHRSGLRNPDDSPPDGNGFPDFYTTGPSGLDWCLADRTAPTESWRYNNCDYIILGAVLEAVTATRIDTLIADRIAEPLHWFDTRLLAAEDAREFVGADETYRTRIANYGASAALVGTLGDMLNFDRALMNGSLLGDSAMADLWNGDPALGYMALGQWVFDASLAGCDAPVRIVERRGGIGKYQLRNIILPDNGIALALATDQEDFDFGEIWMGSGAMHDTLAAVVCS